MLRRKTTMPGLPGPTKFDRMATADLETALETALSETARIFRGLTNRESDREWLLREMSTHVETAAECIGALRRKL